MGKETTTEKYIKKAVNEAKKELSGTIVSNCTATVNMESEGATQTLAEALLAQSVANEANSEAMRQLARTLKPIEVCAFKIEGN